jgi:hypothetical protein
MITCQTTCSDIHDLLRKMHFFHQKSYMTLSLDVRQNGPEINLPVSRAQRTFARAVYNELTAVLGADVIAYSTVTKSLRQRQFTSILVDSTPEEPATIAIDQALLDFLEQDPFSSIRELVHFACIPTNTVYRHLTQSLGFMVKHLRWLPHTLTPIQKAKRAALSLELLRQLRSIGHHGWLFIITLDESWSYLSTDHEQIWFRVEEQLRERRRHTIQDPKMMVTIAGNPL